MTSLAVGGWITDPKDMCCHQSESFFHRKPGNPSESRRCLRDDRYSSRGTYVQHMKFNLTVSFLMSANYRVATGLVEEDGEFLDMRMSVEF